jgi:hypothetical protein
VHFHGGINGDVITQEVHAGEKMGTRRECWLAQIILGCKSIWNKWVRQDLIGGKVSDLVYVL